MKPLARICDGVSRVLFAASIPGRASIGKNVFFHHSGLGVVINAASVIGDNCEIGVHVVLGGQSSISGAPHLCQGVIVYAGAKLLGPIEIGEGAVVAANSVVLENVTPHTLVAGVPAIVKKTGLNGDQYRHDYLADNS